MVHWVKGFGAKLDDLSSIPGAYMGQSTTLSCPLTATRVLWHALALTQKESFYRGE